MKKLDCTNKTNISLIFYDTVPIKPIKPMFRTHGAADRSVRAAGGGGQAGWVENIGFISTVS